MILPTVNPTAGYGQSDPSGAARVCHPVPCSSKVTGWRSTCRPSDDVRTTRTGDRFSATENPRFERHSNTAPSALSSTTRSTSSWVLVTSPSKASTPHPPSIHTWRFHSSRASMTLRTSSGCTPTFYLTGACGCPSTPRWGATRHKGRCREHPARRARSSAQFAADRRHAGTPDSATRIPTAPARSSPLTTLRRAAKSHTTAPASTGICQRC